jgi:hypothetical protein
MSLNQSLRGFVVFILGLGIPLRGLCQTAYAPPTVGLVGWWRGDGNANDSSGNGHHGTLEGGMGFTAGLYGQAFAAGSGKRVFVPDSPAFQLTSLTMAAWVNPTAPGNVIFFRGDNRPGLDPYDVGMNESSCFGIVVANAANTPASLYAPTPLPFNTWTHVVATFDDSAGDLRVYLNGLLVAETNTSIKPFFDLEPSLTPGLGIGNVQDAFDFPFQGAIEEVLLYSRAISPTEVQQLYQPACSPRPATATATVVNGFVVGATISDGGCGYTNVPLVLIQGGGGNGATATAVVSNGVISGITITDAGIGYTNLPTIILASPLPSQVALVKSVRPSLIGLSPGFSYQLQISTDLQTWTNQGPPLTATNTTMSFPQYFDLDNWNQLFFRLQASP